MHIYAIGQTWVNSHFLDIYVSKAHYPCTLFNTRHPLRLVATTLFMAAWTAMTGLCLLWGTKLPESIQASHSFSHRIILDLCADPISQECTKGMSWDLAQMSTWTQRWPDCILMVKGQDHCDIASILILWIWYVSKAFREFEQIWKKNPLGIKYELFRFWWSKVKVIVNSCLSCVCQHFISVYLKEMSSLTNKWND